MKDKFKAVWLSHSSISDYLKCPRMYFLRNVYKNPKTFRKMTIMTPPLALGQTVHEVIESLSVLPVSQRFDVPLSESFDLVWKKIEREKGGFKNSGQEEEFKSRGLAMLKNIEDNPGPIAKKAIKLRADGGLPYYWFSEEDNIILCGKVDWIEYLEKTDSVHIIDFKSGKFEEGKDSLQLPIYYLLATNLQNRNVEKASYWYLDKDPAPKEVKLPEKDEANAKIEKLAKRIKLARQINHFVCPTNGCKHCLPFERVLKGEGKMVSLSDFNQEIYVLKN